MATLRDLMNPLDIGNYVQQQGELGRQRGERSYLGRLVSEGMSSPGGLASVAPKIAAVNPDYGMKVQGMADDQQTRRAQLLAERAKRLAPLSPEQRAQVWPSLKADIAAVDPELGNALSDIYDHATTDPLIQQFAGMGGGSELPSEIRTLEYLQRNPELMAINDRFRGQKSFKEVTNPDGTVSYLALDNRSGQGQFAPVGGAQAPQGQPMPQAQPGNGDPKMDALVQAANAMRAANVPIEQIDAFLMQAAQQTPGVQVGQGAPMQQPAAQSQPLPSINQIGGGIPGAPRGLGQSDADRARAEAQQAAAVEAAKLQTQLRFAPEVARSEADATRLKKEAELQVDKQSKAPKARMAMEQARARTQRVEELVGEIMPQVDAWTAGWAGEKLSEWSGTRAADMKKNLGTLQAIAGFQELNDMRASSPTGGALGNVTERELAFLQSVIRNIENSQSPTQLRRNLAAFQKEVQGSWQRIEEAYQEDFGGEQQQAQPAAPSGNGWEIQKL